MREQKKTRVLIFGANGMLGSTIFRKFSSDENLVAFGTLRDSQKNRHFSPDIRDALIADIHMNGERGLLQAFSIAQPDVVINCIGIIKQLPNAKDHLETLSVNALLPHRLAKYCGMVGARLVHFSTDCVFSGKDKLYREDDVPDAHDLYGRTKYLGEVDDDHAVTLRTSIVGHELGRARSLVDWFLSQTSPVKGYEKAIFSGLPTIVIAHVVRDLVIPNRDLKGLYHLSGDPISKLDLLRLVAKIYGKDIEIVPDDKLVIDRSLNSDRFRRATGFAPKPWPDLVEAMHEDHLKTWTEGS